MAFIPGDLDRLAASRTIGLTTHGRRTGLARRVEIWWFRVEDRFIITGSPGRRDWLANVVADPNVIIHVNGQDIDAMATVVYDRATRTEVFSQPDTRWYSTQAQLERLVEEAPMIEIHLSEG